MRWLKATLPRPLHRHVAASTLAGMASLMLAAGPVRAFETEQTVAAAPISATITPAASQNLSGTLAKIARSGKVFIGYRESALPFSYVVDGKVTGYATDICAALVQRMRHRLGVGRLETEFIPVTTATRFILVGNGSIDMECGPTTNTAERRRLAEFSYPYFLVSTRFVSRKGMELSSVAALSGRSVVAPTGSTSVERLNALSRVGNLNISVILSKDYKEAFRLVEEGRVAALVADDVLLAGLVASSSEPDRYEISSAAMDKPEPYGLLLPPGDAPFKAMIDSLMLDMFQHGEMRALYKKWFESPIPPQGKSLALPMSPELDSYFQHPRDYNN